MAVDHDLIDKWLVDGDFDLVMEEFPYHVVIAGRYTMEFYSLIMSDHTRDFVSCWINKNQGSNFFFKDRNDALKFKLTWAGCKDLRYFYALTR